MGAQPASSPCDSELSLPPATPPPGTSPAHARVGHPRSGCRSAPCGPTGARPSASRPHRPQLPLLCCSNSPRLAGAPASPEALSELGGQAPAQSADSGGPGAQSLNASQAPGIGGWRGPHIPHSRCPRTRLQAARLPLAVPPSLHTGHHPACSAGLLVPEPRILPAAAPGPVSLT